MPLFIEVFAIVAPLGLAVFCIFCASKPEDIAAIIRRRYARSSKLDQKWPFADSVLKPWYPTYLRVVCSFGFIFAVVWLYAVLTLKSRRIAPATPKARK